MNNVIIKVIDKFQTKLTGCTRACIIEKQKH